MFRVALVTETSFTSSALNVISVSAQSVIQNKNPAPLKVGFLPTTGGI
jgi:hypothetical protein